jgi:hypothetical protein
MSDHELTPEFYVPMDGDARIDIDTCDPVRTKTDTPVSIGSQLLIAYRRAQVEFLTVTGIAEVACSKDIQIWRDFETECFRSCKNTEILDSLQGTTTFAVKIKIHARVLYVITHLNTGSKRPGR